MLEQWIEVALYVVSFLTGLGVLVIPLFVSNKNQTKFKKEIEIIKAVPDAVIEAEKTFGKGKGTAKLSYVLTMLRIKSLQNKVEVDDKELTALIEKEVQVSKNVNKEVSE